MSQKKLATDAERKNGVCQVSTQRKKQDIIEIANEAVKEKRVIKGERGKKRKMQEETPVSENAHSETGRESISVEYEDPEDINCEALTSGYVSTSIKKHVACGNWAADKVFQWLIRPTRPEIFFEKNWENKPFFIPRNCPTYYNGLFSVDVIVSILKENELRCDQEIDIVAYVDGERRPLIYDKDVSPNDFWKAYKDGYSIRMRNPQAYHEKLRTLCSLLQEYFSSYVGANMYFTPPDTQGFPPHYDDIDAFILQIEGKKLWKLYSPSEEQELAKFSSPDLNEEELGLPYMEVELNPGDLLYFPRGFIHQAKAASEMHSLHITLSTNQLNTWSDLLQIAVTQAIEDATQNNVEFRKSIPKDFMNYMGCIHSDKNSKEKKEFVKKGMQLIKKSLDYISLDYAADCQAISFIHGSLPPTIISEKACSVHGYEGSIKNGKVILPAKLSLDTKIRQIRKRAMALDVEGNEARLFHSLHNSKNHKEKNPIHVQVDLDHVPALIALFKAHPEYLRIKDLPHEDSEVLLTFLQKLYNSGLLMTERPLPCEE